MTLGSTLMPCSHFLKGGGGGGGEMEAFVIVLSVAIATEYFYVCFYSNIEQ